MGRRVMGWWGSVYRDVNIWSKIRSSPSVRVMADGGSKNELMPAFFVQSGASSALDRSLETSVGPM